MRVLYFTRGYTTHDRRFLERLAESVHEVFFLRLEQQGVVFEQRSLPSRVHPVPWAPGVDHATSPDVCLRAVPEFQRVVEEIKPDVVQAGPVQTCGYVVARASVHPLMITSWGYDILLDADHDDHWRKVTLFALENSDMLLCDCYAVRDKVQALVSYADERIVQFPWGVELDRYSPGPDAAGIRRKLGWNKAFVVLSTRNWESLYGIKTLLAAFAQAHTCEPRLRLILLGTGTLQTWIEAFIAEHDLDRDVFRPGLVAESEVPHYLRAADIYFSCSRSDGSSVSLLQALATGLPTLVSDIPGNRECVKRGANGWLAPSDSHADFAEALLRAACLSRAEQRRMHNANRALAERKADWSANFPQLLDGYERLVRMTQYETRGPTTGVDP